MQNNITERIINKRFHDSSKTGLWEIPYTHSKQDWFGSLPYYFSSEVLNTIQQVYNKKNQYICSATQTTEGIKAIIYVGTLLGIEKEMSYVPASTISAIVSQCSALVLWSVLRSQIDDPRAIYNRLVENELVGFKKEQSVYRERVPLRTEIPVSIQIKRVVRANGNLVASERISLGIYMYTEILGYAFLKGINSNT